MNNSLILSSAFIAAMVAYEPQASAGPIDYPGPGYRRQLEAVDVKKPTAEIDSPVIQARKTGFGQIISVSPGIAPVLPSTDFSEPIRLFPADKALIPASSGTGVITVPAKVVTPAPAK